MCGTYILIKYILFLNYLIVQMGKTSCFVWSTIRLVTLVCGLGTNYHEYYTIFKLYSWTEIVPYYTINMKLKFFCLNNIVIVYTYDLYPIHRATEASLDPDFCNGTYPNFK